MTPYMFLNDFKLYLNMWLGSHRQGKCRACYNNLVEIITIIEKKLPLVTSTKLINNFREINLLMKQLEWTKKYSHYKYFLNFFSFYFPLFIFYWDFFFLSFFYYISISIFQLISYVLRLRYFFLTFFLFFLSFFLNKVLFRTCKFD